MAIALNFNRFEAIWRREATNVPMMVAAAGGGQDWTECCFKRA